MMRSMMKARTAGRTMCKSRTFQRTSRLKPMSVNVPMEPTNPQVSHAGAHWDVRHVEDAGGKGADDGACQCGRYQDPWMLDDVGNLQHGCSDALSDQTANTIFTEAGHSESNHLRAAADGSSARSQTGQVQHDTEGSAGNGCCQSQSDNYSDEDAEEEGLPDSSGHDGVPQTVETPAHARADKLGGNAADDDGDSWGDQNVHLGFL